MYSTHTKKNMFCYSFYEPKLISVSYFRECIVVSEQLVVESNSRVRVDGYISLW